MASTYTTDLAIQLMATGENAGTWGQITNTNLVVVQQAIAGYESISIAGGAQTTALVMTQNALANARNAVIKLTGTITGNQIVTIPNGIQKTWIVSNGTTGAFTVQFKYASTGTGQTWSTTDKGIKILYADGSDIQVADLSTLSGSIVAAQITNSTITQAKLAANSIGTNQLQTNAVTAVKITQSTITQAKLASNSVGSNQLISTGVTAATYTAATITVDADGRITSASSGSGGAGGFLMTNFITGPASGTFTKNPATNYAVVHAAGAQSGPGGNTEPGQGIGGIGGFGGFSYFNIPMTGPYSVPYTVGAAGNAGANQTPNTNAQAGNAGGVTNFSGPATFTTNAGTAGNGSPAPTINGNPGSRGNAAPGTSFSVPASAAVAFVGNQAIGTNVNMPNSVPVIGGGAGLLIIYENIGT